MITDFNPRIESFNKMISESGSTKYGPDGVYGTASYSVDFNRVMELFGNPNTLYADMDIAEDFYFWLKHNGYNIIYPTLDELRNKRKYGNIIMKTQPTPLSSNLLLTPGPLTRSQLMHYVKFHFEKRASNTTPGNLEPLTPYNFFDTEPGFEPVYTSTYVEGSLTLFDADRAVETLDLSSGVVYVDRWVVRNFSDALRRHGFKLISPTIEQVDFYGGPLGIKIPKDKRIIVSIDEKPNLVRMTFIKNETLMDTAPKPVYTSTYVEGSLILFDADRAVETLDLSSGVVYVDGFVLYDFCDALERHGYKIISPNGIDRAAAAKVATNLPKYKRTIVSITKKANLVPVTFTKTNDTLIGSEVGGETENINIPNEAGGGAEVISVSNQENETSKPKNNVGIIIVIAMVLILLFLFFRK